MMRLSILMSLMGLVMTLTAQEVKFSGRVLDAEELRPLPSAMVQAGEKTVLTDANGLFVLKVFYAAGMSLKIEAEGYEPRELPIGKPGESVDMGDILLRMKQAISDHSGIAEVSQGSLDFDDESKGQYVSSLLQSGEDVFNNTASYVLSAGYYRVRGYDSDNSSVYINNIFVNDQENGRPVWSEWGGLNDVTRNRELVQGIGAASFAFGDIGGATNIITRASMQRKQMKLTYSLANRGYRNRLMYTWSTGLMRNNWAFTISASRRWSEEGYVEGTFYDAWAYLFSAEKKLNGQHSVALTAFASPTRRGMQAAVTQEIYDLMDDHFYNPNWGYQEGEKRNARVRKTHEPKIILSHIWEPAANTNLTTSLAYSFGRYGTTALNWYNAADPRPDYYRYLPSYQETPSVAGDIALAWKTDPSVNQIDWNRLYQVNYLANLSGQQARYIVEERRQDHRQFSLSSVLRHQPRPGVHYTGGLDLLYYTGQRFKVLNDLLGGKYWLDIDQFAQRDFDQDTSMLQNDLDNPNRKIYKDDRFGYDYELHVNTRAVWGQAEYQFSRFDVFTSLRLSQTDLWRVGNMRNGRAPENSLGKSEVKSFLNYGLKAGITYKISGMHYLEGHLAYITQAPYAQNAFISQQIKDDFAKGLDDEKVASGDISYIVRHPKIKARITAYQSQFTDQSRILSFYHDDYLTYVNMSLTGIDKVHQGFELGAEIKVTKALTATLVAGIGNHRYTSRPTAVISTENGSLPDSTEVIYSKYFYVSGSPQNVGAVGFRYALPHYWYLNGNLSYYDKNYLDYNPISRTSGAIINLGPGDPLITTITEQKKLNHGSLLDLSVGKSIRYKSYFININFSVNNVLDNQDLITSGYEQLRFDFETKDVGKFPPRYFFAYGRTFFFNINFRI